MTVAIYSRIGADRHQRRALVSAVAAVMSVTSCSAATEPLTNASATVVQQTVARNVDGTVQATFRIVIENRTARVVYYSGCAVSLERQDANARWEFASSPLCALPASSNPLNGMQQIPAGASSEATVHMSSHGDVEGWPADGLGGIYRLRVTIASPLPVAWKGMMGIQYKSHSLITNEFALEPN